MIGIRYSLSTKIIKKGDYFSIYLNITNGHEKQITLTGVNLFQPTGFIQREKIEEVSMFHGIIDFFKSFFLERDIEIAIFQGKLQLKKVPGEQLDSEKTQPPESSSFGSPARIPLPFNQKIQPNDTYRVDFNLKAGWSGGLRPRPDTYIISAEVEYNLEGKKLFEQINIEVSIFPSLGSMLVGTLVGSLLGTVVNVILPPIQNKNLNMPGFEFILAQISANLILGFIVGITLMRKKDVQPFLTVEDFWGGILLGFLVGYSGQQIFKELLGPAVTSQT